MDPKEFDEASVGVWIDFSSLPALENLKSLAVRAPKEIELEGIDGDNVLVEGLREKRAVYFSYRNSAS